MSNSRKPTSEMGFDSITDRFRTRLSFDNNKEKPDSKHFNIKCASPVSPLKTCPTPTSSSSTTSSSGSVKDVKRSNHSGELSVSSETSSPTPNVDDLVRSSRTPPRNFINLGHRRSSSGTSTSGSGSGGCSNSTSSPLRNTLPAGNICPSGKILTTGLAPPNTSRRDVLGSGNGNYGHGSIMRGSSRGAGVVAGVSKVSETVKMPLTGCDLGVVKEAGNDLYKRGLFAEALRLYDRAIAIAPSNAVCRSNRAAALIGLGRLADAVRECEEAVRLDPKYARAHQRLGSLHLRLGQVENARHHLCFPGQQLDSGEVQKLQEVEKHFKRWVSARSIGDWKSALREVNAAIAAGADSSPQLFACRAEALLKLHQFVDADSCLSNMPKFESYPLSCSTTKFFGMLAEAYIFYVRARVAMSLGRFENAVKAAEKAGTIDPKNYEIAKMLHSASLVKSAWDRGNDHFSEHKFIEAASAYGEGLKLDPSNTVLYSNRAACWSQLGRWEKSVEDCNEVLKIQPSYTKVLRLRAESYGKLERWTSAEKDYELLRKVLPGNNEVAEALFHAQVTLKKLCGKEARDLKFSGEVLEVSDLDHFKDAISSTGISIVYFKAAANQPCEQISPIVDMLCIRHPSLRFLKVDVEVSLGIAKVENMSRVPAFKIYENGIKVMEMIRPSGDLLESAVRDTISRKAV